MKNSKKKVFLSSDVKNICPVLNDFQPIACSIYDNLNKKLWYFMVLEIALNCCLILILILIWHIFEIFSCWHNSFYTILIFLLTAGYPKKIQEVVSPSFLTCFPMLPFYVKLCKIFIYLSIHLFIYSYIHLLI